ncbi:MAG: PcfJ domain-containing protein [Flavobacteriaceae bacterium]|jgi:DNA-directed RNA polymerase subunit RPC12/RpoP|nr:PcfJ domain-containing protein [Flavobacteriaceae bacterium]
MKPRTKIQIAVDYLQSHLKNITDEQKQYAFDNVYDKYCYRTKNKAFCLECGDSIDVVLIGRKKSITCPHCKSKLKVEYSNKRTFNDKYRCFGVTEIVNYQDYQFQVVRAFDVAKYCKKGEKVEYRFYEVCQNWYDAKSGKHIIYSRLDNGYSFSGNLEIRNKSYWKTYDPYISVFCPTSMFQEKYSKYGINHQMNNTTLERIFNIVRSSNQAETLLKAGYSNIINVFQTFELYDYWKALKISIRYKYKIKEADIYRDYLQLLKELKKDLSNPSVVCPKNLKREHDKVLKIVSKKRAKEEAIRIRKAAVKKAIDDAEALKKFQAEKEKFFDIEINGNGIKILPLKSIEDFISEAETHKHCVLSNSYYKREDSLILKALVDNKSVETIEFSLTNMKIVQSRGLQNKPTEYHDDIINLLNSKIHLIKKIHLNH